MNMTFKLGAMMLACAVALSGCQSVKGWLGKRDNGSLDYQNSAKLNPIKLPANQAAADFIPLYPTPSAKHIDTNLTNESGKQFELPKPPTVQ